MNEQTLRGVSMKVSVATETYNHERYIAQALDSILMQEVGFDYEIVIGEDCSTDKTRAIVLEYKRRYPETIRLLLNERNLGGRRNFVNTLQACRGEYIALLEGDDYWTSSHKLQKQVDYLDSHPECASCFHNATVVYQDGREGSTKYNDDNQKEVSFLDDLLRANFIATCSVMFRRGLINGFPRWFFTVPVGDWALHILNAQHGWIGYMNEVMAAHLIHDGGVWSRLPDTERIRKIITFYKIIRGTLHLRYRGMIDSYICGCYVILAERFLKRGHWAEARACVGRCLVESLLRKQRQDRGFYKLLFRLYAPRIYDLLKNGRRLIRPIDGGDHRI